MYDIDGRRRSSMTAREEIAALQAEMDQMSPAEREMAEQILAELEEGESPLFEAMNSAQYEDAPVPVETFLTDPYFCGAAGKMLYPQLQEDLVELFEGDYNEAVITGSIGFGKSTFSEFGLLRMVYEFGQLKDPQGTLGLMPGSPIVLGVISVNLKQAQRGIFGGMIEKMARSTFFQSRFQAKVKDEEMIFPKNIRVIVGSPGSDAMIGMNVVGGVVDESNFMDRSQSPATKAAHARQGYASNANTLYRSIVRRMKSRYMRGGKMPGVLMLVSSKGTVGSFTEQRIKVAKSDPRIFVREYATWDVKPPGEFTGKRFAVLVGDELINSRILKPGEVERTRAVIKGDGRTARVILVPEEYREDFDGDLEGSLRDIAGVATMAIRPFISRRETIPVALSPKRQHPFTVETWVCGEPGEFRWDLLCRKVVTKLKGGFTEQAWQPLSSPTAVRHVHLDLSGGKQDALGFAMGHIVRWRDMARKRPDGTEYMELAPEICVDVVLQIVAPPGGEIMLSSVRALVYDLQQHGFQVSLATTDRWQYFETHQQFEKRGIKAELLSLDTSSKGYDHFKAALYEGRLLGYEYAPLKREIIDLEQDPATQKVDHPVVGADGKRGSKDCADAVAGVVCSLVEHAPERPMGMLPPSPRDDEDDDDGWVMGKRAKVVTRTREPGVLPSPFLMGSGGSDDDE